MDTLIYLVLSILSLLLSLAMVLLTIRAILSWFPGIGGRFADTIHSLTEPLLLPVRKLFYRIGLSSLLAPFDFSFLITYILLAAIQTIISMYI